MGEPRKPTMADTTEMGVFQDRPILEDYYAAPIHHNNIEGDAFEMQDRPLIVWWRRMV